MRVVALQTTITDVLRRRGGEKVSVSINQDPLIAGFKFCVYRIMIMTGIWRRIPAKSRLNKTSFYLTALFSSRTNHACSSLLTASIHHSFNRTLSRNDEVLKGKRSAAQHTVKQINYCRGQLKLHNRMIAPQGTTLRQKRIITPGKKARTVNTHCVF